MFNNISIKLKMVLMLIVPITVILIFLGIDGSKNYSEVKLLKQIEEMVAFSQKK